MIASWWEFTVLALGSYRLTRLVGWDDLPPVARLRNRVTGQSWALRDPDDDGGGWVEAFRRPTLAHFLHCPFCVGFWVGLAAWLGYWLGDARTTILVMLPFALSAVVGLVAKRLDP